jgi:hypothetical protein
MGEGKKVSLPHNLCHVVFDACFLIWFGKMLVLEKKIKSTQMDKGVNTTIHMDISHHAFSLHCIQIPNSVLVFDQFLSYCCSDPLGIEALLSLILDWKCLLFSWSAKNDAWVMIWNR